MPTLCRYFLTLCCLVGSTAMGQAGTGPAEAVLELFRQRCSQCHSPAKSKAQLSLTSLDDIARGGKSGLIVVPGKPAESLLWQVLHEAKMPPKKPLPPAESDRVRRWIEQGAPGLPIRRAEAGKPRGSHWAFQPPVRPLVPAVKHPGRLATPIDAFILAALEAKQLTLNPEADRPTLIRRVSFDLTGLPPTREEVEAFVHDSRADAYELMVDHYLASPHYGERWGKYWLDAAGYADSNGYFSADSDRPLAYFYRDYVVRSLNADKPYDQFVREQLAGDELAGYVPGGDVTPPMVDRLTATHFLRNAPDGTGESDGNPDEVRTDRYTVLEGTVQITMSSLLGITIQCARCHEHKFEPIRHEEYYQLQAIFYPGYCPDRWRKPAERELTLGTRAERAAWERRNELVTAQIKALRDSAEAIAKPFRAALEEERLASLAPAERQALRTAAALPREKRTAEQQKLVTAHASKLEINDGELAQRFPDYTRVRDELQKAQAAREKDRPAPLPKRAVFVEVEGQPLVHHVLLRGQHNRPGPEVQPGVPEAFCGPTNRFTLQPGAAGQSTGRRTAFANWVTSPANPLFARVMVNRLWQHHFGRGLVATPENLGQSGARPSNQPLLDYLATELVQQGWHLKALHRQILCSATYRQTSDLRHDGESADPDNILLWRFPLRRLDAEAVRDAMLAATGELDRRLGGPYVPTQRQAEGNVEVDEHRPDAHRRSLYLQQRRTQVATMLELFDAPSIVSNCTYRNTSTVPLQSLALLNSPFALARAQALSRRLEHEAGPVAVDRIRLGSQIACGREPESAELQAALRFLSVQHERYAQEKKPESRAWNDFSQMLFASNAFLYVE